MDEPLELSNYEVIDYIDKILEVIERNNLPEEKERGLMKYYDKHDSVNAKVSKYEFSVDIVDSFMDLISDYLSLLYILI